MKLCCLSIALLVVGLLGCAEDSPEPIQTLPDVFHGTWELLGTSGGLDGEGVPAPEGERSRIVLGPENVIERHGPDGEVTRDPFTVRRGKSIFSRDEQWLLRFAEGVPDLVVEIYPDGTLGMSENVYDGYGSSFRRIDE